jgi:hypothetical protein
VRDEQGEHFGFADGRGGELIDLGGVAIAFFARVEFDGQIEAHFHEIDIALDRSRGDLDLLARGRPDRTDRPRSSPS